MKFKSQIFLSKLLPSAENKILCIYIIVSILLVGCSDKDEPDPLPDLKIYLDRFEQEAKLRGLDLDLSHVEAVYLDEIKREDNSYCGYGYPNYEGSGLRRIEISSGANCKWAERSDIERENLFFHEIGHAFLNRSHENSLLCDGSPLSLMATDIDNFKVYKSGEEEKRAYYISELIDRTKATDQCIDYKVNWVNDSVFYKYTIEDDAWKFESHDGNFIGTSGSGQGIHSDSLAIELKQGSQIDQSGKWFKSIIYPNVPECTELTLSVTMNSDGLIGNGAAISIRAFQTPVGKFGAQTEEYLYLTTTEQPVQGKLNNYKEELTIPCFSRKTTFIVIFLRLMKGTEGKVSFKNIELVGK